MALVLLASTSYYFFFCLIEYYSIAYLDKIDELIMELNMRCKKPETHYNIYTYSDDSTRFTRNEVEFLKIKGSMF